jgi:glycosyltransferase involved in cell wall biosynthesis
MRIYLFSPIRYDFLHQRPQKLADQFLALSIPVTYVQPTSVSEHLAGNLAVLIRVLAISLWYHFLAATNFLISFFIKENKAVASPAKEGLTIISLPMVIPPNKFNSPFVERLTSSVYRKFLVRKVLPKSKENSVAIFQNPLWGRITEREDFNIICYDCMDDVVLYSGNASMERFKSYEDRLIENSDFVVTTAAKLESDLKVKHFPQPIYRIPNGVDYDWFQKEAACAILPKDLAQLKRPLIGYVGHIAAWTDYDLITEVAKRMPEASFVFVGPLELEERRRQLLTSPNIFWLGKKPYAEIPGYIKAFDVCIIPFRQGSIAETTNPVKVFEYFALGKPIVATPMNELVPFSKERLLWIGNSTESFVQSLREAIVENNLQQQLARMRVAERHSWRNHAQSFLAAIDKVKK